MRLTSIEKGMKERKMMLTESNPGTWTVGIRTAPCGLEAYCPDRVAGKEEEVFPFCYPRSSDVRCGGGSCLIRLFEAGVPAVLYWNTYSELPVSHEYRIVIHATLIQDNWLLTNWVGTRIVLYSSVSNRMKVSGIGVPYIMQRSPVRANLVRSPLGKSLYRGKPAIQWEHTSGYMRCAHRIRDSGIVNLSHPSAHMPREWEWSKRKHDWAVCIRNLGVVKRNGKGRSRRWGLQKER